MNKINIGIVAHVDAGKTTVTENLLYLGGVIKEIGRVDNGNTQTDSMELERKRGITIKAAVVSFNWKDVKINILDTPGHADFVSEVERALSVLDGAVLVVSAVEGIQAHTLMLFNVLKKLRIPTVIFINKLDRTGSNYEKVILEMKKLLSPNIIPIQKAHNEGTNKVQIENPYSNSAMEGIIENLCDIDENLLEAYVNGENIKRRNLERKIELKSRRGKVYPVLLGAALKGIGITNLMNAIIKYLPYSMGDEAKPLSGVGLKVEPIERGKGVIYVSEITTGYLPKTFQNAIEEAVYDTLKQGLLGWEVTDIKITLNYGVFDSVMSTPADFRNLTPMVLMNAINNAKTELLEPMYEFELKINKNVCGKAVSDLNKLRADFENPVLSGEDIIIEGLVPVNTSQKYNLEVSSYTEGKGMFVTKFHGFRKISLKLGKTREKYRIDPLNKKLYMMYKLNTIRK